MLIGRSSVSYREVMKAWLECDEVLRRRKVLVSFGVRGCFCKRWCQVGKSRESVMEQIILPKVCRREVMRLAHTIPMAGRRLLSEYYEGSIGQQFFRMTIVVVVNGVRGQHNTKWHMHHWYLYQLLMNLSLG